MILFHFDVRIAMSQFSWIRMKMGIKEKLLEHLPGDRRRTADAGPGSCNVLQQQAFPGHLRTRYEPAVWLALGIRNYRLGLTRFPADPCA